MDVDLTGGARPGGAQGGGPGGSGSSGSAPKKKRSLLSLVLGFLMWPLFFVGFGGAPSCMGFEEPTLAAIAACPPAAAALGPPLSRSYFGWSCGNAESSDAFGNASWTFPVTGSVGRGSVDVVAERRGGPWRVLRATVETSAGTWEVVSCSGGGSFSIVPTRLEATVTEAIGSAPVAAGTACTIDISPGDGPFPCRVVVTCVGQALYGATSSTGFMQCTPDARGALTANDTSTTPSDNDPMFDLRVGDGRAILTDAGPAGTWVLTMSFAPPPGLGPPPPPLAPSPAPAPLAPPVSAVPDPTLGPPPAGDVPTAAAPATPGVVSPLPPPPGGPVEPPTTPPAP